ncbi:hypothetical protein [Streptomyces sp. AM 2-1-1]|uniref:hypothetical protein n=1 Tax=Streptomyces sp. AM 2-1-1 TaxID=3028709 RepID=UPI0023B9AC29|nr:hypothetical protein [Streptomyces sp. AM 2-1-1]WEH40252.1 hypothetical protein PZB77_12410 [Streptomyces sp. AM 2-1-1]
MFPNTTTRPSSGLSATYSRSPAASAPGWARPDGTSRLPSPVPPRCVVPDFAPLRVRGGGASRLRRAVYGRQRALAAGFALAAAALAASGLGAGEGRAAGTVGTERPRAPVRLVSAPVRIADAATVRLLRPGDRVDVISAPGSGDDARMVARGVRVGRVPGAPSEDAAGPADRARGEWPTPSGAGPDDPGGGALVVLSVTRETAVALAGAHAAGELLVAVSDA